MVARVNEHSIAPEAGNSDLMGLVQGLQALNPELQKYNNAQRQDTREQALARARADAAKVANPTDALTGAPTALPEDLPPAYNEIYSGAYRTLVTQRAAVQTAQGIEAQYEQTKGLPDFNAQAFLAEQRQKALAGVQDPHQVEIMGRHLDETEQSIRSAETKRLMIKQQENAKGTMFELASSIKPDLDLPALQEKGNWLVQQGGTIQVDPASSVRYFFEHLRSLSSDAQGKPELFDALTTPDKDGNTLLALANELANEVNAAKQHASLTRERRIHEETEGSRYQLRTKYDKMVDEAPELVTEDEMRQHVQKNEFSAEQAASYVNQARDRLAQKALQNEALGAYDAGMLGRYEPEVQKKVLEVKLGPAITAAWRVFADGANVPEGERQSTVQALSEQIMQAHSKSRASIPVEALTRLVGTSVTSMPDAKGPSPGFLASAALYRALSGSPQYRDLYFKGEADDILRTYNSQAYDFGRDSNTAYQNAYLSNSPEAKANAEKKLKDPNFAKEVEDTARKAVSGSTWLRLWGGALGMNGRPQNDSQVGDWITQKARELKRTSPYLSDDDVKAKVESMARDNWVMDSTSRHAVRVPSGLGTERTGDAFTDLTNSIVRDQQALGTFPTGSAVRYFPVGDTGMYQVKVVNGTSEKTITTVSIQDVTRRYDIKTNLQPEEAKQLYSFITATRKAALEGGTAGMIDPVLLRKGQTSGFISSTDMGLIDVQQHKASMAKLTGAAPAVDLGTPTNSNTFLNSRGQAKVDHRLTSQSALELLDGKGGVPLPPHLQIASSLAAVREGVALGAYQDPARGAGINIGAGYNLKGNAATVDADLKAVGVAESRLADVKTGRAALTPDQVKWLTQLTIKRLEPQVKAAAESTKAGLWDSMSPQQKAVMVDVAYQTGKPQDYKKAWTALAAGDSAAFQNELKTYFTNHQGQRTEDTRALDLRASVLKGLPAWKARLTVASQ